MTLEEIRARLAELSEEMTALIRAYGLQAQSPLHVLSEARRAIIDDSEYIRFLELSLEGRILAEEGHRLMQAP